MIELLGIVPGLAHFKLGRDLAGWIWCVTACVFYLLLWPAGLFVHVCSILEARQIRTGSVF